MSKIKDGANIINLDECQSIGTQSVGTHWIALYAEKSFAVEYIPKEIRKFIGNKIITTSIIHRIQADDSIMCGSFCIAFIDFMLNVY